MKKISAIGFSIFLWMSCSQTGTVETDILKVKDSLLKTDQEFSKRCEANGMGDAFVYYASEDVVKLREGKHPLIGRKQLKATFSSGKNNSSSLSWEIMKVDVAQSADLGYTFGNWKYTTRSSSGKDTTIYGNYITVWKRQTDGTWKYVIDGGNTTPPPRNSSS